MEICPDSFRLIVAGLLFGLVVHMATKYYIYYKATSTNSMEIWNYSYKVYLNTDFEEMLADLRTHYIDNQSNSSRHSRRELRDMLTSDDEMDVLMAKQLQELLAVFSVHAHSGFSAEWAISLFTVLARRQPLSPLTGEDDEWSEPISSDGTLQNIRASNVFKYPDGKCYDINGIIFEDPDGHTYTGSQSKVKITFPYSPFSKIVKVDNIGQPVSS